jgi:hypothetical protein
MEGGYELVGLSMLKWEPVKRLIEKLDELNRLFESRGGLQWKLKTNIPSC